MINWDILQPVDIGRNFQAGFQTGSELVRKHKLQGALAAYSADPTNPENQNALASVSPEFAMNMANSKMQAAAQAAERQRVGQYFVDPDRAAAKQRALEGGELDIAKQIDGLGEDERKRAAGMYKFAGPVANEAKKLPYEQRKAFIMQGAPQLLANGWTQELLDGFDPTDANLNMMVTTNLTLEQAMEKDKVVWHQVGDRPSFATDTMGKPVGSANPYAGGGGEQSAPPPPPGFVIDGGPTPPASGNFPG